MCGGRGAERGGQRGTSLDFPPTYMIAGLGALVKSGGWGRRLGGCFVLWPNRRAPTGPTGTIRPVQGSRVERRVWRTLDHTRSRHRVRGSGVVGQVLRRPGTECPELGPFGDPTRHRLGAWVIRRSYHPRAPVIRIQSHDVPLWAVSSEGIYIHTTTPAPGPSPPPAHHPRVTCVRKQRGFGFRLLAQAMPRHTMSYGHCDPKLRARINSTGAREPRLASTLTSRCVPP